MKVFFPVMTGDEKGYKLRIRLEKKWEEEATENDNGNLSEYGQRLSYHVKRGTLEVFRKKETMRVAIYNASLCGEKLDRRRQLARKRQKEWRERNKCKQEMHKTRQEAQRSKATKAEENRKAAERMQRRRQAMTAEEKAAHLASSRARYHAKKQSAKVTKETQTAHSPRKSPFKTTSALRKAASRAWSSTKAPKNRTKFAQVQRYNLVRAMKSKEVREALKKEGIAVESKDKKKINLVQRIKSYLSTLKSKKDRKSTLLRKSVLRGLKKPPDNKSLISKTLACRRSLLSSLTSIPEESEELHKTRNGLPLEERMKIGDFFSKPYVTTPIPDTKKAKKGQARSFLNRTIRELHKEYKKESGSHISLTTFAKQRPENVLKLGQAKHISCLCELCANIDLKLSALRHQCKLSLGSLHEFVESTLCATSELPKRACMERKCPSCGFGQIEQQLSSISVQQISWHKWGRHGGDKRVTNLKEEGSIADFTAKLRRETLVISKHLFVARWQYRQFSMLKQNLPHSWVVGVQDFSENYRCFYQQEVQSAYYSYTQVTIFPTVVYYACGQCGECDTDCVTFISGDTTHDAHAVKAFTDKLVCHIQNRQVNMNQLVLWSDGAAAHFKSKKPFLDLSFAQSDYGIKLTRCFFGSRHGKGPCDGLGAVIKQAARRAVLGNTYTISNAQEFAAFAVSRLPVEDGSACCHNRQAVYFVSDICREGRSAEKGVKGTRHVHQVESAENGVFRVRNLACFCSGCQEGTDCQKKEYVDPWKCHSLVVNHHVWPQGKASLFSQLSKALSKVNSFGELENLINTLPDLSTEHPIMLYQSLQCRDFTPDLLAAGLCPVKGYTAICIEGDGNCLPRSASVLAYGDEEKHQEMRCRIVAELVSHSDWYLNEDCVSDKCAKTVQAYSMFSGMFEPGNDPKGIFQRECMDICKNGAYMGIWQIHAVASILKSPILSIYPERGPQWVRDYLHRVISPRHCATGHSNNAIYGIMWTSTKEAAPGEWSPNHFVVCLPDTDVSEISGLSDLVANCSDLDAAMCVLDSSHQSQGKANSVGATKEIVIDDVSESGSISDHRKLAQLKPGDFISVRVHGEKSGSMNYAAEITCIDRHQIWGRFLERVPNHPNTWRWPAAKKLQDYVFPVDDIVCRYKTVKTTFSNRAMFFHLN